MLCLQFHTACVSRPAYMSKGGTKLRLVHPGNYSVRVRARSLAGNGSFTENAFFFMPDSKAPGLYILSLHASVTATIRL